jgi:hypothetical protein
MLALLLSFLQVRYFLSYDQLNIRMREARYLGKAVRATWLSPGWEPPEDEEALSDISKQAARMANKMQALKLVQAGTSNLDCYLYVLLCVM